MSKSSVTKDYRTNEGDMKGRYATVNPTLRSIESGR